MNQYAGGRRPRLRLLVQPLVKGLIAPVIVSVSLSTNPGHLDLRPYSTRAELGR
jgi:hypothetical protein